MYINICIIKQLERSIHYPLFLKNLFMKERQNTYLTIIVRFEFFYLEDIVILDWPWMNILKTVSYLESVLFLFPSPSIWWNLQGNRRLSVKVTSLRTANAMFTTSTLLRMVWLTTAYSMFAINLFSGTIQASNIRHLTRSSVIFLYACSHSNSFLGGRSRSWWIKIW